MGRIFRPVVTAPPGRAIVELDLSQIEVGIVAAEYSDTALIHAYNTGDVYSHMAKEFYVSSLSEQEGQMTLAEFKAARPDLRDRMKTLVLAIIYNVQAPLIASRLKISMREAEALRQKKILESISSCKTGTRGLKCVWRKQRVRLYSDEATSPHQ